MPCGDLTCRFVVEGIPLHLAIAHITADKVLAVAQKHTVSYCVDIRRSEVCNAGIACVLAIIWRPVPKKLFPDLQQLSFVCL